MSETARSSTAISPRARRPESTSSPTRRASARASAWRHSGQSGRPAAISRASVLVLRPAAARRQQELHSRLATAAGILAGRRRARAVLPKRAPNAPLTTSSSAGRLRKLLGQAQARAARRELRAARAKELDVGVPEGVDRLQLVADREQVVARQRVTGSRAGARLVSWNSSTISRSKRCDHSRAHVLVVAQQVARGRAPGHRSRPRRARA